MDLKLYLRITSFTKNFSTANLDFSMAVSPFQVLFNKYKRACITGYCIRCIYGLFLVLKSRNKSKSLENSYLSNLKQIFFTMNHYRFASSISSATATYSLINHLMLTNKHQPQPQQQQSQPESSNINKTELRIKLLAIITSMTWFKFLPKQFREMIVLHLFVRAVYDLIKLYKYDPEYRILPSIPHDEIYIGAAALTGIGYGIYHNPWIFDEGYYKFILKWGSNTHEQIGNVFRSKKDPKSSVNFPSSLPPSNSLYHV